MKKLGFEQHRQDKGGCVSSDFNSHIAIKVHMNRNILMLEHDDDDRYITQSVFDQHNYPVKLHFVTSSDELFAFLTHCETNNIPLPSLILLNYYAAPLNSVEILKRLKSDQRFLHIPVVVLSGTLNKNILHNCYSVGANSFIQKPALNKETNEKISTFIRYWFETVELP
jgi:CheY-like chemotaxis protein